MSDTQYRHARLISDNQEPTPQGRNVIVVIGVDEYMHLQQLHNAVSDARGVRDLFVDQFGFQELVPPLYNKAATRIAITSLVLDELNNLLEPDDSLLFFFAGHGHTETRQVGARNLQTGYLIPVEGERPEERKFSSYLRLDAFLEDVASLPARHILVILDACYSGFALGDSVQILRSPERYREDLSRRMSRRVITSAMSDQPALDNGPMPGHSLFTGTLVEGLTIGKADDEHKGFVTSSELALYLQKQVASWSDSKQTPDFGAFELDDRGELIISLVGETQSRQLAQECLQIADHVYELGRYTNDPKQYRFAAQQYRAARQHALLGKLVLPAAEVGVGRALFAAGETAAAIAELSEVIARLGDDAPANVTLYLGLAQAKARNDVAAASLLEQWYSGHPAHEHVGWIGTYILWLQRIQDESTAHRRALLIGIDQYEFKERLFPLQGCVNDVQALMAPLLTHECGFHQEDIHLLLDSNATKQNILSAFQQLREECTLSDTVVIHYSGHSVPSSQPLIFGENEHELYLLPHDTREQEGKLSNGITAIELHEMVNAIPAAQKLLILDTHGSLAIVELAEQSGDYNLILASDTAEMANEWTIEVDGNATPCGMLSGALYQATMSAPSWETLTYDQWINDATQITHSASKSSPGALQTPLFVGQRDQRIFQLPDPYLPLFEFAERKRWGEYSFDQLSRQYQRFVRLIGPSYPQATAAFGQAFFAHGAYDEAHMALAQALAQLQRNPDQQPSAVAAWSALLTQIQQLGDFSRRILLFLLDVEADDVTLPTNDNQAAAVKTQLTLLSKVLTRLYQEAGYELTIHYAAQTKATGLIEAIRAHCSAVDCPPTLVCILGYADSIHKEWHPEQLRQELTELTGNRPILLWVQRSARNMAAR